MKLKRISLVLISIIFIISMSACSDSRPTAVISGEINNLGTGGVENGEIKYVFLKAYLEEEGYMATVPFSISEDTKFYNNDGKTITVDLLEKDMNVEVTYYEVSIDSLSAEAKEIKVLD